MRMIDLVQEPLPKPLFSRLARAVRNVGLEGIDGMGSYKTTFWFPRGSKPANIVEECVGRLCALVRPGPRCIGMEWWLGRLKFGESLAFHTDRDRSLRKHTGQIVYPLWSSILYLNRFPSSPTIVLDQVLGPDGKWVPPKPKFGRTLDPVPNHYVVFRGDLRHGVVAKGTEPSPTGPPGKTGKSPELRLTLLVNYWDRRPMPPNCRDYDGTLYGALNRGVG